MMWRTDDNSIKIEVRIKTYTHKVQYDLDTGKIWIRAGNKFRPIREVISETIESAGQDDDLQKLGTLNQMLRSGLLQFLDDLRIAMQPILSRDK